MTLFLVIALGLVTLGLLWWGGKLSSGALSLTGAALSLGLVGYALQGSPSLPAAPVAPRPAAAAVPALPGGPAQEGLMDKVGGEADTLAQADAYFRVDRPDLAARVIRLGLEKNPQSPGLWTGLGNALVAHDKGLLSPPAEYCYQRALRLVPGYPGALYYYAILLVENDRASEAKPLFAELVRLLPPDAPMRARLIEDLQKAGLLENQPSVPRGSAK